MDMKSRRLTGIVLAMLVTASAFLGGCAIDTALRRAELEQRIASASTRADHEQIASLFEQQAGADREAAARHERMARTYAQPGRYAAPGMATHCENLVRTYRQAADGNAELAKMHRQVAAGTKQ